MSRLFTTIGMSKNTNYIKGGRRLFLLLFYFKTLYTPLNVVIYVLF